MGMLTKYGACQPQVNVKPDNNEIITKLVGINTKQTNSVIFNSYTSKSKFVNSEDLFNEEYSRYAVVMLAVISDMDKITWTYNIDGKAKTNSITTAEANVMAGNDIKIC